MPSSESHGHTSDKGPDFFTRLSIAMCEGDDGTRPVDPSWPGSEIGWASPAISFSPTYPLPVNVLTTIKIEVRNLGTMDATGAWLECVYNMFIGNESQGNVPIASVNLPTIPSGSTYVAEVPWTPPDMDSTHACVHARVFDTYSIMNYPDRVWLWSSYENPQAGNRNATLVKITNVNQPLILPFRARNFGKQNSQFKLLMTQIDTRARFIDVEERFPMPFRPERPKTQLPIAAGAVAGTAGGGVGVAVEPNRNVGPEYGRRIRLSNGLRLPSISENGLWPRTDIHPRFIHKNFGVETSGAVQAAANRPANSIEPYFAAVANPVLTSLHALILAPNQEQIMNVVIPQAAFPPAGRRAVFQIDYQIGSARPVQRVIYLVH